MKKLIVLSFLAAAAVHAQTPIYNGLELKSGSVNFSDAGKTQPVRSGTLAARPASCAASKELYNVTDPASPGQSLYVCNTSGNGWNLIGDGNSGGGGGGGTGLAVPGGNGVVVHTGSGAATARTITGTAGETAVTNGDGVSGNPTISLASAFDISAKTSTKSVKTGTTPPATCSAGELFIDTDAPLASQFLVCSSGNIWTAQGAASGGSGAEFIPWQPYASVGAGLTRYVNMSVMASTEPLTGRVVMTTGNLVEMRMSTTGTQNADGALTCTVRRSVSGTAYSDTAAVIAITNADGTAPRKVWTGSVAVNAGDLLSVACVNSATSTSVSIGSVVLKVQ